MGYLDNADAPLLRREVADNVHLGTSINEPRFTAQALGCSEGVTLRASMVLYQAKEDGRKLIRFYDSKT